MTNSNLYEIKVNGTWTLVRATSMVALSQWCKANSVEKFRSAGMMSRLEILASKSLTVLA